MQYPNRYIVDLEGYINKKKFTVYGVKTKDDKTLRRRESVVNMESLYNGYDANKSQITKYLEQEVTMFCISNEAKSILIEEGLPETAAPWLMFNRKIEKFNLLQGYVLIGCDSAGNFICIQESDDKVKVISHDNLTKCTYINSSLSCFIKSIVAYSKFISVIKLKYGRKAYLHRLASKNDIEALLKDLMSIDNTALGEGTFWTIETNEYLHTY